MKIGVISPQDWGLPVYQSSGSSAVFPAGCSPSELERRIRLDLFDWLPRSWDPPYDYSVSTDQVAHHVRGMMFLLDYLGSR